MGKKGKGDKMKVAVNKALAKNKERQTKADKSSKYLAKASNKNSGK